MVQRLLLALASLASAAPAAAHFWERIPVYNERLDVAGEAERGEPLPLVVAHGMGDACVNPGMHQVTQRIGEFAGGTYRLVSRWKWSEEGSLVGVSPFSRLTKVCVQCLHWRWRYPD